MIGFYLDEEVPPGLPLDETVRRIHAQGGVAYLPHPFDRYRRSTIPPEWRERAAALCDVIEVGNGRTMRPAFDRDALALAGADRAVVLGAGSDAHYAAEVGRVFLDIPAEVGTGIPRDLPVASGRDQPARDAAGRAPRNAAASRSALAVRWTSLVRSAAQKRLRRVGSSPAERGRTAPRRVDRRRDVSEVMPAPRVADLWEPWRGRAGRPLLSLRPPLPYRALRPRPLRRTREPGRHALHAGLRLSHRRRGRPDREEAAVPLPPRLAELQHRDGGLQLHLPVLPERRHQPDAAGPRAHPGERPRAGRRRRPGPRRRLSEHLVHLHRAHRLLRVRPRLRRPAPSRRGWPTSSSPTAT